MNSDVLRECVMGVNTNSISTETMHSKKDTLNDTLVLLVSNTYNAGSNGSGMSSDETSSNIVEKAMDKYDTYKDRPLSGALEKIHINTAEILCTLLTLQLHVESTESTLNAEVNTPKISET